MAVLAALLIAAPPAGATWSEPDVLSPDGSSVGVFAVGINSGGDATAVWGRFVGSNLQLQTRTRAADGTLRPIQNVSPDSSQGGDGPKIAELPDGRAVIAWGRIIGGNERVQVRQLSAAGVLGPTLTLSGSGQDARYPDVAIDPDGDAVIVWDRFDGTNQRIQARTLSAGGVLGSTQNLSPSTVTSVGPTVGVDADGNAVISWLFEDDFLQRVQSVVRAANGTLGPVRTLSPAGAYVNNQRVAVAANGRAAVVWQALAGADLRAQLRALDTAGSAPSPTQNLSAAGADAGSVRVAMAPNGVATGVWIYSGSPDRLQLRTRAADPGGTLGPTLTLSSASQSPINPDIAEDADGDAMVTWQASDGQHYRAWAREHFSGGTLGPARAISPSGMSAFGPVDVIRAPGGATAALWAAAEGTSFQRADIAVGP